MIVEKCSKMNNFVIDFENVNLPMYSAILIAHIVISIVLSFLAFYIVVRSVFGLVKNLTFSTFLDYYIPVFAVVLLYIELILGLILYNT